MLSFADFMLIVSKLTLTRDICLEICKGMGERGQLLDTFCKYIWELHCHLSFFFLTHSICCPILSEQINERMNLIVQLSFPLLQVCGRDAHTPISLAAPFVPVPWLLPHTLGLQAAWQILIMDSPLCLTWFLYNIFPTTCLTTQRISWPEQNVKGS